MSNRTREINKITTTIISISVKLMVYALIVLLLYEAVARGFAFGHEIFYAEAVDEAPGKDMVVRMDGQESVSEAAEFLARNGLIKSEFAFIFQSKFYDYDTIYPGTYTLNTSMTSKEILQLLNEKPETAGDGKPAVSGGAKAAGSSGTSGNAGGSKAAGEASDAVPAAASETGGTGAAAAEGAPEPADGQGQEPQSPEDQGLNARENYDNQANDRTYEGEDQEMEGGWIEDATEDGAEDGAQ